MSYQRLEVDAYAFLCRELSGDVACRHVDGERWDLHACGNREQGPPSAHGNINLSLNQTVQLYWITVFLFQSCL